jgi:cold shock protein
MFGTVKNWIPDRGFGFIKREDGQPDVFVHVTDVERAGLGDRLQVGQRLQFDLQPDRRDPARFRAINLKAT